MRGRWCLDELCSYMVLGFGVTRVDHNGVSRFEWMGFPDFGGFNQIFFFFFFWFSVVVGIRFEGYV